jgi:hypothetical protein
MCTRHSLLQLQTSTQLLPLARGPCQTPATTPLLSLARSLQQSLKMFTRLRRQSFLRVQYSLEDQLSSAEQLLYMAQSKVFDDLVAYFARSDT